MAFPASQTLLSTALVKASKIASDTKNRSVALNASIALGSIDRDLTITYMSQLTGAINAWNIIKATPGIAEYAKVQYNDPTLDIAAEFNSMVTTATTTRDWIFNNFPKDGSGAWLINSYSESGQHTDLQFTKGQLSTLVTEIDLLITEID